jgi:hypothetical protein
MDRAQWERIQEIYRLACSAKKHERDAYIAAACGNNAVCIREVGTLLKEKGCPDPGTKLSLKPSGQKNLKGERGSIWKILKRVVVGVIVFTFLAAASFGIYHLRKSLNARAATTHSFKYWLMVQKMRAGLPYHDPEKSNGGETFDNGDQFRLNIVSDEPAYVYIFNEAPPEQNSNSFTLDYPRADLNSGSAAIGANQVLQTDSLTFKGPGGANNVWIVWSSSPVTELENLKSQAFRDQQNAISGDTLIALKTFLTKKEAETRPRVSKYKEPQHAIVRGANEMFVTYVSLQYH